MHITACCRATECETMHHCCVNAIHALSSQEPVRLHSGESSQRHALHRRNERPASAHIFAQAGFDRRLHQKIPVHCLVYYEMHALMDDAIRREKQLKEWRRLWKIRLIESMNPEWLDLFDD